MPPVCYLGPLLYTLSFPPCSLSVQYGVSGFDEQLEGHALVSTLVLQRKSPSFAIYAQQFPIHCHFALSHFFLHYG